MKLYNIPDYDHFDMTRRAEITYADGTKKNEEYVVLYDFYIKVYENNKADSPVKETIHVCDGNVESVRWLRNEK